MKRRVHRYYHLLDQYNRYRRKLNRLIEGTSRYARKALLIKRLKRIYVELIAMKKAARMATTAAALSAGFVLGVPNIASAQNLKLATENVLQLAHMEGGNTKLAFVDFDGDNDQDMFVGGKINVQLDSTGMAILYFENEGGVLNQKATAFPIPLGTPAVLADSARVSPAFIDQDMDGDFDAFVGIQNGNIMYFRNDDGTMVNVTGTENPFDGIQVGNGTNANPTFADIDGDGDMDAIIGKYDGLIAYFENDGGAFTEMTDAANPFSDVNVTESAAPTFVDFDGDGDLDLFVGNKAGEIAYYDNVEGVFTAVDATANPFSGISLGYNTAPAFADIDGDADMDLFIADGDGQIAYFRNDEGTFTEITRNNIGLGDLGDNVNHALVDIDIDGDQDLVTGEFSGNLIVFNNTDGVFSPSAENPLDTPAVLVDYISSPAFADIDGDGDMDLFLGSYTSNIEYHANDNGVFTQIEGTENPFDGIDPGDNENIAFVDWDNDGDLDALIGNKAGEIKYYENTAGAFTEVVGAGNPFDGISFQVDGWPNHSVKPAVADRDGDGDMDVYCGLIDGNLRLFENEGGAVTELTGSDNPFDGMDFGRSAAPEFGDIDGDGDMDLLVSNAAGLTFHFDNTGISTSTRDITFSPDTEIYPNPTSGKIQIEAPWLKAEKSRIQVLTVSGGIISEITAQSNRVEISLHSLPTGLYLVKVIGANGQAVKKVLKR